MPLEAINIADSYLIKRTRLGIQHPNEWVILAGSVVHTYMKKKTMLLLSCT